MFVFSIKKNNVEKKIMDNKHLCKNYIFIGVIYLHFLIVFYKIIKI